MHAMATRVRSHLRGTGDVEKLAVWLHDVERSGLYGIRHFAQALGLAAVRNAITEIWSNGQV